MEEEEFLRQDPINQIDGAIITPESMTPNSSPTTEPLNPEEPNQSLGPTPNLQWDHSPERLSEDNAFFWEEEPLQALTASDILDSVSAEDSTEEEEKEIRSPLGVFRRQGAFRRKSPSNMGYASQSVNNPQLHQQVQLEQVSNLGSVLLVRRPLAPELVALDDAQQLDMVLPADGAEEERFIN